MNTTSCVREREVSLSIAAERVTIVIRQIRNHRVIVKALFLVVITKKVKASREVFSRRSSRYHHSNDNREFGAVRYIQTEPK